VEEVRKVEEEKKKDKTISQIKSRDLITNGGRQLP
jgi:hypothetical protein